MKIAGFQHLTIDQIRTITREITVGYFPAVLQKSGPFPLEKLCDHIYEELGVRTNFEANLGKADGRQIYGALSFSPLEIFVDECLKKSVLRRFVLAHELGHFILHRHLKLTEFPHSLDDTVYQFQNYYNLDSDYHWLEWQANRFATELLLPVETFRLGLIRAQTRTKLTRNLGRVYISTNEKHQQEYDEVALDVARVFNVPSTMIDNRLRELKLIEGNSLYDGLKFIESFNFG